MNRRLKLAIGAAGLVLATQAAAQVTFYEQDGFRGRSFATAKPIGNFEGFGFNDRASSAIVERGTWEVCEDARFSGRCIALRPGQYPSLRDMGLNDRVSSVRPMGRSARVDFAPPPPQANYRYYPRANERLFPARVVSVRAVVNQDQQRCWVERENVVVGNNNNAIPGAILGAVVGGVLGHQVGGGRGQDVATAVGAVGGAAVGANVGRNSGGGGSQVVTQDVQRCRNVAGSANPDYWDVTYDFRGQLHRAQMTSPPGETITVNGNGEPRA
jgi:uncharacterized protein YcfJ